MNGVELMLRAVHDGEARMADELTAVAGRHTAEHEVHHVATDLAAWSREHVRRLADMAGQWHLSLKGAPDASLSGFLAERTPGPGEATSGHPPEPGLLLLRDLRTLHLAASENSLHWEMLGQAAQATKDGALLRLVSSCHPRTIRQMRWTNTMVKTLSPQILSSL